ARCRQRDRGRNARARRARGRSDAAADEVRQESWRRPPLPILRDVEVDTFLVAVRQFDFHYVVTPAVEYTCAAGVSAKSSISIEEPLVLEVDAAVRCFGRNSDRRLHGIARAIDQRRRGNFLHRRSL